jgi:hypothetical protein
MKTFKVTFSNGDSLVTGFNGTLADAQSYYLGNWFNMGPVEDLMVKGVEVLEVI